MKYLKTNHSQKYFFSIVLCVSLFSGYSQTKLIIPENSKGGLSFNRPISQKKISYKDTGLKSLKSLNGIQSQVECSFGYNLIGQISSNLISSLSFINGYRFNEKYFLGIGIGGTIHHFSYNSKSTNYNYKSYPIFLRSSIDFRKSQSTPYSYLDLGSQFENPNRGKTIKPLTFRTGIGKKWYSTNNTRYLSLSYSYKKQRTREFDWNPYTGFHDLIYSNWQNSHSIEFSLGLQFN